MRKQAGLSDKTEPDPILLAALDQADTVNSELESVGIRHERLIHLSDGIAARTGFVGTKPFGKREVRKAIRAAETLRRYTTRILGLPSDFHHELFVRLQQDLGSVEKALSKKQIDQYLGRLSSGGKPNELIPYCFAIPSLAMELLFRTGKLQWKLITEWAGSQRELAEGTSSFWDVRQWWHGIVPKTVSRFKQLPVPLQEALRDGTTAFIDEAALHNLIHHTDWTSLARSARKVLRSTALNRMRLTETTWGDIRSIMKNAGGLCEKEQHLDPTILNDIALKVIPGQGQVGHLVTYARHKAMAQLPPELEKLRSDPRLGGNPKCPAGRHGSPKAGPIGASNK